MSGRTIRSLYWRLGAVLAVLASAVPARAVELATGADYPPYVDEHAPQGGLAVDLVRQAYLAEGVQVAIHFLPWRRGYEDTQRGGYVATFPYLRNSDRERDFLYSAPLYPLRLMMFYAGGVGFAYAGLDSLKGRTTCIEFGGIPQRTIRTMIDAGEIMLVETKDILGCVRMMGLGRVDFMIVNEQVGKAAIAAAALPDGTVRMLAEPIALMSQYLLVPRSAPDAAAQLVLFDRGLAKLKQSGVYDEILDRHLGAS